MRVYELAKQMSISNKELMSLLISIGIEVTSHMSSIDEEAAQKVQQAAKKQTAPAEKQSKDSSSDEKEVAAPAPQKKPAEKPAETKVAPQAKKEFLVTKGSSVKDVADLMGVAAGDAVKKLIAAGMMIPAGEEATDDVLLTLANAFDVAMDWQPEEKAPTPGQSVRPELRGDNLKERHPIVTVMGHVDHGKTSTLDAIRKTNITAREAGGITQHIGASHITYGDKQIVFLDTPGHAAFTSMRARGAQVTDIAVLVVAADDGVMPQTVEAINHAKAAGVPIIVAVNKMDKPGANPDQIKHQLGNYGLVSEEWGGDTPMVYISAKSGEHIDDLLEMILLVAEMEELKADPSVEPEGVVIEARLDKGKGTMATVIVQQGTLRTGDVILLDSCWGRVRAMLDDNGKNVKEAGPSMAVEILGLSAVPQPGERFRLIHSEKEARDYFAEQDEIRRNAQNTPVKRMTLEDLYSQMGSGEKPNLPLVVKCDVQGTIEAITGSLEKLSTDEVSLSIVHTGVGRISESDIMLASASNAVLIGFNVRPDNNAVKMAERENVQIRLYRVIYDIIDEVRAAMEGLLTPTIKEKELGQAEIRAIFKIPKAGKIAGCMVTSGTMKRGAKVRLVREGIVIWEGSLATLRRIKDEAAEVNAGYECGMSFSNYQDFREGDIVECFELVEEKRSL